jgi:hypothetical protein
MLWQQLRGPDRRTGLGFLRPGSPLRRARRAGGAGLGRDRRGGDRSCWSGRARCRWRWWARKLSHGIDAFALTAVPLFILTGDVLVRTGLSRKFLDVAEALTQFAKGGFGSATVLVCGMFAAISGSDAAGAAAVGRMTIDRLVESAIRAPMPARWSPRGLYRHPDPALDRLHHHRPGAGHLRLDLFLAAVIPGIAILSRSWPPTSS